MSEATADIGLIGLGVMGSNLALNMDDHGYVVAVYNRTYEQTAEFMADRAAKTAVIPAETVEDLVAQLKRPRRVMLLVPAGNPVDSVIAQLTPLLEPGDIIIDGGNSHYPDTERRTQELADKGLLFVGCGVSGGEEGARYGPSLMPGGNEEAWPHIKEILQAIAAKVSDGTPCCDWVGRGGAGHYVKMVHNGIEYGDMQLISEAYDLMQSLLGMTPDEMSAVFARWDEGKLDSYLIEITADILAFKDDDGAPLLDKILDTASQKGTGKWTAVSALDVGIPLTLISEAVFARFLSALKEERVKASGVIGETAVSFSGDKDVMIDAIEQALYAAKIVSYAQGYMLLRDAAVAHEWDLDYGGIALLWREGCIIRAAFLEKIKEAYVEQPDLTNLLLAPYFQQEMAAAATSWRQVVAEAMLQGIPVPGMAAGLTFYDGYRRARLPANMIQAQRDYFGAHTYQRVDKPSDESFHTDWDA